MRVIAVVSKKPRLAGVLFCVYRGIRDELTRLALPVIWFSEESTVGNMIRGWTTDVNLCFFCQYPAPGEEASDSAVLKQWRDARLAY